MEATQKKGFFKGKLAKSVSRVTKRISIDSVGGQNMANCSSIAPRVCSYSYKHPSSFHEQKNYVADHMAMASSMQKVSYASFKPSTFCDQNENWGHGDENIDVKATTYISNVLERFKLDRVDSNGNNYQEML